MAQPPTGDYTTRVAASSDRPSTGRAAQAPTSDNPTRADAQARLHAHGARRMRLHQACKRPNAPARPRGAAAHRRLHHACSRTLRPHAHGARGVGAQRRLHHACSRTTRPQAHGARGAATHRDYTHAGSRPQAPTSPRGKRRSRTNATTPREQTPKRDCTPSGVAARVRLHHACRRPNATARPVA